LKFESADEVAQELGISRSELYANAVADHLAKHRGADLTAKLHEVYGGEATRRRSQAEEAQARRIWKSDW
jgi:hypothetical protein